MSKHSILLGSFGGDSHSVGLHILKQALIANNYQVFFIGIQNKIQDFVRIAKSFNIIMMSNMDGHAIHYLQEFEKLLLVSKFKPKRPLWYLGGNVSTDKSDSRIDSFLDLGFDRVLDTFTDISTILEMLEFDLASEDPVIIDYKNIKKYEPQDGLLYNYPTEDRIIFDDFKEIRKEVLKQWKTGKAASNLNSNALFLSKVPSFSDIQDETNKGKRNILFQPRSGVGVVEKQIDLFQSFKKHGVKVLSYQVDSLTRQNNYKGAERAIKLWKKTGKTTMNGFPVVNHGVEQLRRIITEVCVPLQVRHSTRDPRLLAEISFAGGVTAFEGGAICYNIPYYKDYKMADSIRNWQYVDRLTGQYYDDFGIKLDREYFGVLTTTLIPPCIAISTGILEAILAVQQGVKCVSLGYAEQGNRVQDIAAIKAMGRLAKEFIEKMGYSNIQINTIFNQYMASFPPNIESSEQLIYESAITAKLSGATRIITKSPVEHLKIPSMGENLRGLDIVKNGIDNAEKIDSLFSPEKYVRFLKEIDEECEIINFEVNNIVQSIIRCGEGNIVEGIIKGFEKGYLDVPFSPSIYNRGEVVTARDKQGSVRFVSTGNLPLNQDIKDFHREKIASRKGPYSPTEKNYLMVENDVMQLPRNEFETWPLSNTI